MTNNNAPKKPAGIIQAANNNGTAMTTAIDSTTLRQPDYELEGLPWITEYHILKNKRYIITNNSINQPQLWNIDSCKLVKSYRGKNFE